MKTMQAVQEEAPLLQTALGPTLVMVQPNPQEAQAQEGFLSRPLEQVPGLKAVHPEATAIQAEEAEEAEAITESDQASTVTRQLATLEAEEGQDMRPAEPPPQAAGQPLQIPLMLTRERQGKAALMARQE